MLRSAKRVAASTNPTPITWDELIRSELQGKVIALARYDEILWKIRAGYIAVLYGMLAIFIGKEPKVAEMLQHPELLRSLLPLSTGLSLCALLVDTAFVISKLRVVESRDKLADFAAARIHGPELGEAERRQLVQLFHISGEAFTLPPTNLVLGAMWSVLGIYLFTPSAMFFLTR